MRTWQAVTLPRATPGSVGVFRLGHHSACGICLWSDLLVPPRWPQQANTRGIRSTSDWGASVLAGSGGGAALLCRNHMVKMPQSSTHHAIAAARLFVCMGFFLVQSCRAAALSPCADALMARTVQTGRSQTASSLLAGLNGRSSTLRLRGGGWGKKPEPGPTKPSTTALTMQQHLLVGGAARGTAVGMLFPIDALKTKLQVGQKVSLALQDLPGYFRGFRLALLGQIPYGMLVFGSYETLKSKIFAARPELQDSLHTKVPVFVGCACVGDTIGALWLTPTEIVKQRLQAAGTSAASASAVIKGIYTQSGMPGFYTGFTGLLARDLPYRAMQLPMYEVAREMYAKQYCQNRELRAHEAMLVGAAVGMFAAGLTTPFDVVKSRMMVGTAGSQGVTSILRDVYAQAGVQGVFKGWQQRVGYLGLNNAIFFNIYEFARGAFAAQNASPPKKDGQKI